MVMPNDIERAFGPIKKAVMSAVKNSPELTALASDAVNFEARMAKSMGGKKTEELRTLLGFVMGRLLAHGVSLDALDEYLAATLAQLRASTTI